MVSLRSSSANWRSSVLSRARNAAGSPTRSRSGVLVGKAMANCSPRESALFCIAKKVGLFGTQIKPIRGLMVPRPLQFRHHGRSSPGGFRRPSAFSRNALSAPGRARKARWNPPDRLRPCSSRATICSSSLSAVSKLNSSTATASVLALPTMFCFAPSGRPALPENPNRFNRARDACGPCVGGFDEQHAFNVAARPIHRRLYMGAMQQGRATRAAKTSSARLRSRRPGPGFYQASDRPPLDQWLCRRASRCRRDRRAELHSSGIAARGRFARRSFGTGAAIQIWSRLAGFYCNILITI